MPLAAKNQIALVQKADATIGSNASIIAELTEISHSIENEIGDEKTKYGSIVTYGQNSESVDLKYFFESLDIGQNDVYRAIKDKKQLKLWIVNTEANSATKYDTKFMYCLVESVEFGSETEGFIEVSAKLKVFGESVDGELDTLPDSIKAAAEILFEKPGEYTGEFGSRNKGAYTAGSTYEKGDIITHNRVRYQAVKKVTNAATNPDKDTVNWVALG